jgi:HK97 gp10 family phage protein
MPDGLKVDVSEILKLASDFKRAGGRVGAQVAGNVRKTTTAVERSARRNAPVDTGALRDGITQTITGSGRGAGITGNVFSTAPYGRFVENGTATQAPQPWLGPAVSEHQDAFERNIDKIISGALDG